MDGWFDPALNLRMRFDAQGREQAEAPADVRKAMEQLHRSMGNLENRDAVRAWGMLGNWHRVLGQPEQAIRCHDEAIARALVLEDKGAAFRNRIRRAHARQWAGEIPEALADLETLIDQGDADPALKTWRHYALQHAGKCALDAGRPALAKSYLQRALEMRQAMKDEALLASTEQALDLTEKALKTAAKAQPPKGVDALLQHNRRGWNRWARSGGEWSQPYAAERLEAARKGDVEVVLTPNKRVPDTWLGHLEGAEVLGLASGGGQQMPLFAAAGAQVTSFDLSDAQLARDRAVAEANGLTLQTVQGNMADLSALPSAHFDLIFHPVSNPYAPDLAPMWKEAFRVLKPGGRMLCGLMQPIFYCFDHEDLDKGGPLTLRYNVPYSDLEQMPPERLQQWVASGEALEFGHSMEQLIAWPLEAGFVMTGFYEDSWSDAVSRLNPYFPIYFCTRLVKPSPFGGTAEDQAPEA